MIVLDEEEDIFTGRGIQSYEENDPTDETLDFRFANLTSVNSGGQLPKRGEKDFEPHGTKHQENVLELSRQAMHDALAHVRSHAPKNHIRGFYYGDVRGVNRDKRFGNKSRHGLEDDHVVLVEFAKGPHFKTMGKMTTKSKDPSLWLLPEEALYLVERGFLDLWWPSKELFSTNTMDEGMVRDEGTPMSLQATYALLIGNDNDIGRVSLDCYTVYANLRRTGYVVQRAPSQNIQRNINNDIINYRSQSSKTQANLFSWLFGRLFAKNKEHSHQYSSLVKPGMYRSYNAIYQKIAIIPRHKPMVNPHDSTLHPESTYRIVYFLWKGDNLKSFTKKNPGDPDFRVAIVDAHSTPIPSFLQVQSLLQTVPYNPPNFEKLKGPGKIYQRLKHGWRHVTLAVVDQGVISYLKLVEGAFGEELMYERFDLSSVQGTKRGYRGGVGRGGRGRGRDRGRAFQ
ncbi:putative tRNA-splicing endonuclease subunit tsp-5 [Erysiphe neolycopersici]|uniref:Putative tRNA-splicing endonuclease subunit tsp-5 n=1 Tax=Erysiphe neolycopersici TaxID=212602 RepID=A0A420HRR1_9PEZI|nr:putative tRNA-splicing endonuclease subunit tsp-5 [Erysiphe neolycopersici]